MNFGERAISVGAEALVTGAWLVVVPSLVLVLLASSLSLRAVTLRRAWFGCLIFGFVGLCIGLFGGLPFGLRWMLPEWVGPNWAVSALLIVYLVGVVWILGRALLGWWALQRWTASSRPVHEQRVVDAFEVAKAALGIRSPCYLLAGREVPSPFSVGLVNHRVLLPSDLLEELDDEELRDLALHEMAHVRHRDPAIYALAVLAKALFWPNPLVWLAIHQLKLNAEKVADEAVVAVTDEVKPYSRLLLKMSERTTRGAMVPLAAGVYLHRSFFIQRAEALVAGMLTGGHPPGSRWAVWAGLFLSAGAALAFAPGWPKEHAADSSSAAPTAEGREAAPNDAAGKALAGGDPPVEALLRDGLFFDEPWVRFEGDASGWHGNAIRDRWVQALGLRDIPAFLAYRHLYEDNGGKRSIFVFEAQDGNRLFLVLDRGEKANAGNWWIGRNGMGAAAMQRVLPGSQEEQAIVRLLQAWSIAVLGSEARWETLLREWPDMRPGSKEDAAVMMGESLQTFREFRRKRD